MIDSLEPRKMLSVTLDANGWTVIKPEAGDHVIYVSSSQGKDTNTGLSPSTPVKTLARGKSLIRNQHGDELLLRDGDTWHENFDIWTASGKSAADPVLIGSYGTGARPLIDSGTSWGIQAGVLGATEVDHVAIIGLHFYADGRDPNSRTFTGTHSANGINWLTKTNGLLIEDTQIEGYTDDINLQGYYGPITNVQIRRSTITNAYGQGLHSQGMYATNVTNLLIEGSTFDHNGYNEKIKGAGATMYNHDIYLAADALGVTVRDNVISRAAAYGLQARGGGVIQNNLFLNDPFGMSLGLVNGAKTTPGGVTGSITGNVFLGCNGLGSLPGVGLQVGNIKPGAGLLIANNVFADSSATNNIGAINLTFGAGITNASQAVGLNDITIQNNAVYNWHTGIRIDAGTAGATGPNAINRIKMLNNQFKLLTGSTLSTGSALVASQEAWAGNRYDATAIINGRKVTGSALVSPPVFSDPTRSVEKYDLTIGAAPTVTGFLTLATEQSSKKWNPSLDAQRVITYISAGFH